MLELMDRQPFSFFNVYKSEGHAFKYTLKQEGLHV
jgi:hypothetical protein